MHSFSIVYKSTYTDTTTPCTTTYSVNIQILNLRRLKEKANNYKTVTYFNQPSKKFKHFLNNRILR